MSYDRKIEPTVITQGEHVAWTRDFADYPASLYTLEYRFRGLLGTGVGFNVTATADGDAFDAVITKTNSAACAVTKYGWQAWLTEIADSNNTFQAASGLIDVRRGYTTAATAATDERSPAKIMLDTIDAALQAFHESDVVEYEISTPAGRRRVRRSEKAQLLNDRQYWAGVVTNEIARENSRKGRPLMQTIHMRVHDD